MASKTRISKRTGKPVRAYRKSGTKPAKVKAKEKSKLRAESRSSKPPSLGPQGEEALWGGSGGSSMTLNSNPDSQAKVEAASRRHEVVSIATGLLHALAGGAASYPIGEDIRDLVRNVRVMLSEVDHPTTRPVDKPQPTSEVAALPFQEDNLLEDL